MLRQERPYCPSEYPETALMLNKPLETYRNHYESLYRIQRALVGHISYLAAIESNPVFTEYLLYEPILRVLISQGYTIESEVECDYRLEKKPGDSPRLDFVAKHANHGTFSLEVKWPRSSNFQNKNEKEGAAKKRPSLTITNDTSKLRKFVGDSNGRDKGFLCVFGRNSHVSGSIDYLLKTESPNYFEPLMPMLGNFLRTRFECRVFEYRLPSLPLEAAVQRAKDT